MREATETYTAGWRVLMSIDAARKRVEWAINLFSSDIPRDKIVGKKVLDIGCGTGNGVIATLKMGARSAIGIDRDAAEFGYPYFKELAR